MFGREQRVLLRHYLEQGLTKAAIAEKLGVSRRTVYHWIETGQLDRDLDAEPVRYAPRTAVPWKLDPYKAIIEERLGRYPELSATRLFEEVRAAGYEGGYTQVKVYVRQVRPRPPEEPVIRFETPPGRQAQVDFADFRFPSGKRYALLVVLGYSRLLWVRFFPRKNTAALYEGLDAAFRFFGGVPRELLFDQLKNVILEDRRMDGGELLKNEEFLRFAAHWGFEVRACRPYRAQTKGKVERPVSYLRRNFVYGREFVSDADLEARLEHWLDRTANVRIHGTTKVRPVVRFQEEKGLLLPLAERSYRSLVLPLERKAEPSSTGRVTLPRIAVERRPLATYARIAGGAR
jgi:transposase